MYVALALVAGERFPVCVVANKTKHVVSDPASITDTVAALPEIFVWSPVFVPDRFAPVTLPDAATLVGVIAPSVRVIAGVVVATYNIGENGGIVGDYNGRRFIELTYETPEVIQASDVRINFVNDFYDPDNGIDNNVKIDRIQIGAVVYQTEAPTVFSTGTWTAVDGITPGFRLSEVLHGAGYFQFNA